MRYPDFLQNGGHIGFIAPSFGCNTEPYKTRFESAIKNFSNLGYKTVLGPNCYAGDGIGKSTTPEKCGAEINEFFTSNNCDVILSCGGGETMCEDLNFVDFEAIKASTPKWYMGYSDNTNLTFTLPTLCDTAAIYGINSPTFGLKDWHASIHDTYELLQGKRLTVNNYDGWEAEGADADIDPLAPINITKEYSQKLYSPSSIFKYNNLEATNLVTDVLIPANVSTNSNTLSCEFTGRLLGGCLDCLITLAGTSFDKVADFNKKYADDGIIWFLEACDLNPFSVKRALWQLKNAGWFTNAKGFLIGRSLHYADDFGGFTCLDAYMTSLSEFGVPVVADIDLGHVAPTMPIISGAMGTVSATDTTLSIKYSLT